ncbi:hypothetical protein H0H93_011526 [Arthromyces matolae]|nr:hypothetical protein H0H93_011526 [Arthromyces matolae]
MTTLHLSFDPKIHEKMRESKVLFFRPSLPKPSVQTVEWSLFDYWYVVIPNVPVPVDLDSTNSNKDSEIVIDPGQMIIMDPPTNGFGKKFESDQRQTSAKIVLVKDDELSAKTTNAEEEHVDANSDGNSHQNSDLTLWIVHDDAIQEIGETIDTIPTTAEAVHTWTLSDLDETRNKGRWILSLDENGGYCLSPEQAET